MSAALTVRRMFGASAGSDRLRAVAIDTLSQTHPRPRHVIQGLFTPIATGKTPGRRGE